MIKETIRQMKEVMKEAFIPALVVGSFIFGGITILITPFFILLVCTSCKQAEIFNEQNNTDYTCGDFFWAGKQINQRTQTIKLDQ